MHKDLEKVMATFQKKHNTNTINIASLREQVDIPTHSTGSLMLDLAIGGDRRAGFPEGRVIEIYGPESAGKTTTALLAIAERQYAEAQKEEEIEGYIKKQCIFVDAEHAIDFNLASEYGVDLNELIYITTEEISAEEALDILDTAIRTGQIAMAVIDSVPALLPAQIGDSSYEQKHIGTLALFMSSVMQRISGVLHKNKTTLVLINQVREKIGGYAPNGMIPETTPGGRAIKFYSSIRISVRRGEGIKNGSELVGHQMKLKIVKNKIFKPFREATINLVYGQGIDRVDELFQVALKLGYIHQGGAWFSYIDTDTGEIISFNDEPAKAQGREKMIEYIRRTPEMYIELENKIRGVEEIKIDQMSDEEKQAAVNGNKLD